MATCRNQPEKKELRVPGGFTLLEVLLAMLLLLVPVTAVQTLLVRSANNTRWIEQQHLALQGAETALNRVFAFHALGLWPHNLAAPGYWLPSLPVSFDGSDAALASTSCLNRWCSGDQWVAFEYGALGCTLDHSFAPSICDELLGRDGESLSHDSALGAGYLPNRVARLVGFEAIFSVNDALGLVVRWPKAGAFEGADGIIRGTEGDWHEIRLVAAQ